MRRLRRYIARQGIATSGQERVWVKVHRQAGRVLVAICDADLLGKELKHGKLTICVSEHFYRGFQTSIEEALELAEDADSANLMGKRIVEAAVRRGLVHREAVTEFDSVLHVLIVRM